MIPTELNAAQRAAESQFSKQSHRYGNGHILQDVSDVVAALERISLPPRAQVLDVATGGGHTGLLLAQLGHQVTLADLSASMLARAKVLAVERGLVVETRQHPAEAFPYADETFDLVTCRVAPHHFSSPAQFVAETARVLRTGGWFLLIDGSVPDREPEAEAWIHELEKLRDPSHARFLTPGSWIDLCASAGFTVVSAELHPFKQPDLEWYFDTAATSPENRAQVRELIASAPEGIRRIFQLRQEEGKTVWWWPRLTLIARRRI